MKSKDKLENEMTKKVHYQLITGNFNKIYKKLDENLKFYKLVSDGKFKGNEIVYDVKNNLMSNAGLVLSKQFEGDKVFFKVRKISKLPGGYKRPSQKFFLGECEKTEAPKDFPTQIANAISNSYANVFTIDLVSIVRQTVPKIEITVTGEKYRFISGTGYECKLLHEFVVYKDLETNKKVKREGVAIIMSSEDKYEKFNKEIIDAIDHYCKELVPFEQSRFEIAQRLLHPEPFVPEKKEEEEE